LGWLPATGCTGTGVETLETLDTLMESRPSATSRSRCPDHDGGLPTPPESDR
jgi:hypothetical protein